MRSYRIKRWPRHSKLLVFFLNPVSYNQTSPQTADRCESDEFGALLPEINEINGINDEVLVANDVQSPTNLSPTAPRVSAAIRSNSPASNAYAPSASHKLKSVLPAGSNDPLRKRCWTPQPTALDKYLAGLRHHLSMEERLSICMAVAKNLHDSVAARDGGRPLLQTGNCPHPSLAPPHQEIAANTSRTPCFNDRPVCSTLRINELPDQRRRVLFLIKLPVSRNLSQLVGPSTLRRFRSLGHQEVADRLEAAASQQADNQNTSTKIATKKCEQQAKRHF